MNIPLLDLKNITLKYKEELHEAVLRVTDSGWYLQGEENKCFEKDYASYIGSKYCVAVANGLQALELMLRAYKELGLLKKHDEIIVPANTYIATIIAISKNNLTPVLVEPKIDTLEIDDSLIEKAITKNTKALLIVHLYGRCAYTKKIADICKRHGLLLFEDNAQAHGCMFDGVKTGALGNAAAHSFYPGKNLGAFGDAGAVTTDDKNVADLIRALGNYGSTEKYIFKYVGENSRMSEMDAAVLDVKLKHLDEDNAFRKDLAQKYINAINNPLISLPTELPLEQNVFHQFPIFSKHRDDLQNYLRENGIGTLIHYPIPPHKQEAYKAWNSLSFPITEKIHDTELSIPINPCLSYNEVEYIIETINNWRV